MREHMIKVLFAFTILSLIFSSCSIEDGDQEISLVGRWEATELRTYDNKTLEDTEKFKAGEYVLIFEKNMPATLEYNGKFECKGLINLESNVKISTIIDFCGEEYILTVKSKDTFTLVYEESDGYKEEYDFKRI